MIHAWPGLLLFLALGLPARAAAGDAQQSGEPHFSIGGFGTLGLAHNSTDGAEFIRDFLQPAGPRDEWSPDVDSRFGLQLDARVTDTLDITLQGLTRYSADGDYTPELSLALLRYEPNPDLTFRAGRLGWDVYVLADSRDIGYSYVWVRPSVDYFGRLLLTRIDGGDAVLRRVFAGGLLTAKIYGGFADQEVPVGDSPNLELSGSSIVGGNISFRKGDWLFRGDYARVELDQELPALPPLLAALRATGLPQAIELADDISLEDKYVNIFSAGMAWERGPWQANLMYNRLDSNSLIMADAHSAYLLLTCRYGKWSPYFAASGTITSQSDRTTGLPLPNPLDAAVNGILTLTHSVQNTFTAGVRYDVMPNVDVKLQVDQVHVYDHAAALWWRAQPGWDGDGTIFSMTLDFVF